MLNLHLQLRGNPYPSRTLPDLWNFTQPSVLAQTKEKKNNYTNSHTHAHTVTPSSLTSQGDSGVRQWLRWLRSQPLCHLFMHLAAISFQDT